MPASIAAAKAGVTTGEWGEALREVFGEYRAPTGVGRAARNDAGGLDDVRADGRPRVAAGSARRAQVPGRQARPRRPFQRRRADRRARARCRHGGGLRGHPPDAGRDRRRGAREKASTWSACRSCRARMCRWCARWSRACARPASATCRWSSAASSRRRTPSTLRPPGVAAVYTPKDFELNRIMADMVRIVDDANHGV